MVLCFAWREERHRLLGGFAPRRLLRRYAPPPAPSALPPGSPPGALPLGLRPHPKSCPPKGDFQFPHFAGACSPPVRRFAPRSRPPGEGLRPPPSASRWLPPPSAFGAAIEEKSFSRVGSSGQSAAWPGHRGWQGAVFHVRTGQAAGQGRKTRQRGWLSILVGLGAIATGWCRPPADVSGAAGRRAAGRGAGAAAAACAP